MRAVAAAAEVRPGRLTGAHWLPERAGHKLASPVATTPDALIQAVNAALAERYAVERELGQGGTARVFLAQDERHGRPVALKVLRPEIAAHLGADRFLREIEIVARLQHPHILPLYDSGTAGDHLYFVMPYVEGESLRDRLVRERRLPLADALEITREVASALAVAHGRGIIHRDITPENIMLFGGTAVVADFGIARALSVARAMGERTAGRLTRPDIALGTPEYMSPEQGTGGEVDARSDLYALGCVLYEMLAGRPPFQGSGYAAIVAGHVSEAPQPLRELRPEVPELVAAATQRALAKRPQDRYQSVGELAAALRLSLTGGWPRRRRWAVAGGAAGAAVSAVVLAALLGAFDARTVNPNLRAVMPFAYEGSRPDSGVTAGWLEHALSDAVGYWDDVMLVPEIRVNDVWARRGEPAPSLREAVAASRDLTAGILVWARVREVGDSLDVTASLHDVRRRGRLVREASARIPKFPGAAADIAVPVRRMANALMLVEAAPDSLLAQPIGTPLLAAWRRMNDGMLALRRWDLAAARAAFEEAGRLDPTYAQAQLWAAQVAVWSDVPESRWRESAFQAAQNARRLTSRTDSLRADALVQQADSNYPAACDAYRRLLARDTLDAVAWYGLGDCQTRDPVVLRDRRSPSSWRFRASYHAGVEAYRRALELVPSFNFAFGQRAYDRLTRVLHVETTRRRMGAALPPDTGTFLSAPDLVADTLAYVPRRAREAPGPAANPAALARNRRLLGALVDAWIAAFPANALAHRNAATVLELDGALTDSLERRSALSELRVARSLAVDRATRLGVMRAEARVHLKLGDFESARRIADSALQEPENPEPGEAADLAALAGLVGRGHSAADFLARSVSDSQVLAPGSGRLAAPRAVGETAQRLWVYALMGGPPDSLRAIRGRLQGLVARQVPADRRENVRGALLEFPDVYGFMTVGPGPSHAARRPLFLLVAQRAAQAGDATRVRGQLDRFRVLWVADTLVAGAPIMALPMASAFASVRDTARAIEVLDASVGRMARAGTLLLGGVEHSVPLVRAIALRAQLAAARGDRATARRWGRAVVSLWSGADAEWLPLVNEMRRY